MGVTPAVGFCFSFPMDQTALNRGKLIKWTKGFTNQGAEGADVTLLLEQALEREGMKVNMGSLLLPSCAGLSQLSSTANSLACFNAARAAMSNWSHAAAPPCIVA